MDKPERFNRDEARRIGDSLSIDWRHANIDQFRMGLCMELEYVAKTTDAAGDDMRSAGRIVLAHMKEHPNYYTRLATMEADVDEQRNRNTHHA
jgi:hypothetical protein